MAATSMYTVLSAASNYASGQPRNRHLFTKQSVHVVTEQAGPRQTVAVRAVFDNPNLFPKPSLPPSRNDVEPSFGTVSPSFPRELQGLLQILPQRVRLSLEQHEELLSLVEVVLDLGRSPVARFPQGDWCICSDVVVAVDIEECVAQVGDFGADNRAGIDRSLHRVSAIRNRSGRVVGLTCRVGRAVSGSVELVRDIVRRGESVLLLGPPGVGKTTAIREASRLLADECGRRVMVIDTSNEIAGDGDVAHAGIGRARRMQVPHIDRQHEVMVEAVENHMPQVIVIDEIGTDKEAAAASTIAQRGVQLIATAHGGQLANLIKNPALQDLAGGIQSVTLGDEEARRRGVQKSVLERKGPPVFTAAAEIESKGRWRIHLNLAASVDALLAGKPPPVEIRQIKSDGQVMVSSLGGRFAPINGLDSPLAGGDFPDSDTGFSSDSDSEYLSAGEGEGEGSGATPWLGREGPIRVFLYEVSEDHLSQVLQVMDLTPRLSVTSDVTLADAVVAVRSKLKGSGWLRGVARLRNMPIYAVKSNTMSQVARAVRAILGLNTLPLPSSLSRNRPPSPPPSSSTFSSATSAPPAQLDGWQLSDLCTSDTSASSGMTSARGGGNYGSSSDDDGTLTDGRKWSAMANQSLLEDEVDALEEARIASLSLVLPHCTPVELLPRSPRLLDLQEALILSLSPHLSVDRVGREPSARLRIFPQQLTPSSSTSSSSSSSSSPPPSSSPTAPTQPHGRESAASVSAVLNPSAATVTVGSGTVANGDGDTLGTLQRRRTVEVDDWSVEISDVAGHSDKGEVNGSADRKKATGGGKENVGRKSEVRVRGGQDSTERRNQKGEDLEEARRWGRGEKEGEEEDAWLRAVSNVYRKLDDEDGSFSEDEGVYYYGSDSEDECVRDAAAAGWSVLRLPKREE